VLADESQAWHRFKQMAGGAQVWLLSAVVTPAGDRLLDSSAIQTHVRLRTHVPHTQQIASTLCGQAL
jgi:hypothetical protein